MATAADRETSTVVTAWVPATLADAVRDYAEARQKSVSAVVRGALEEKVRSETRVVAAAAPAVGRTPQQIAADAIERARRARAKRGGRP